MADPLALHNIFVKEQDSFEEPSSVLKYVSFTDFVKTGIDSHQDQRNGIWKVPPVRAWSVAGIY